MRYHWLALLFAMALSHGTGYPRGGNEGPSLKHAEDDSDMYLESETATNVHETRQESQQTFYPSFPPYENPPLGHSRPYYFQQEGAYSHRPQSSYQQQVAYDSPRYSGYKDDGYRSAANSDSQGLLGSGNFGVIRGGTFYDNDVGETRNYERDYNGYFNNGHGGPLYYGNKATGVPNPRPYQHEQFENFRDFADINTPSNPAYSQYVVVYVNKNGTRENVEGSQRVKHPKNIIESLALLDLETPSTPSSTVEEEEVPKKKLSKSKAKLAKLLPEKKQKFGKKSVPAKVQPRELHEPLLALS